MIIQARFKALKMGAMRLFMFKLFLIKACSNQRKILILISSSVLKHIYRGGRNDALILGVIAGAPFLF